jgi:hypothetical protein
MNTQALNNMSREDLIAKIAAMQAASQRKLTCKVSDKGAVSVYGLGRFPVTLYAGQWERLIEHTDMVKAFIATNRDVLATKD